MSTSIISGYCLMRTVSGPFELNETFEYNAGLCINHVVSYAGDLIPFCADPDIEKQPPDYALRAELCDYYASIDPRCTCAQRTYLDGWHDASCALRDIWDTASGRFV